MKKIALAAALLILLSLLNANAEGCPSRNVSETLRRRSSAG